MHRHHDESRLPDLHNPPKPRWREVLTALAGPATRLHRYRNLHRSMLYEAMCEPGCRDGR